MSQRRVFLGLVSAALVTAAVASGAAWAQNAQPDRLALKGYDPVAYFTDAKAVPGLAEHELAWDGQRYRFANARHLALFKANPEKYAPQFGGACAMNMASGVRRESDPLNWVISNGQLYVFAGAAGAERFRQEAQAAARRAEVNWRSFKAMATQ